MATDLLKTEIQFYDEHIDEFKDKYPDQYLLIHDKKLIGAFPTFRLAVKKGVKKWGAGPFLVRQSGHATETITALY